MRALIITFKSGLTLERVEELFRARVEKYAAVDGLLQKLYVHDPETGHVGGIYVFDSNESLEAFRRSELARSIGDAYQPIEPAARRVFDVVLALHPLGPPGRGARGDEEALVRRMLDRGFGAGELEVLDELFAPTFVDHQGGISPPDLSGVKAFIRHVREAFPDLTLTLEESTRAGDKLWTRTTATGTHRGTFMGMPPTGKRFEVTRFDVYRFAGGKIVEHWGVIDRLGVVEQLGGAVGRLDRAAE